MSVQDNGAPTMQDLIIREAVPAEASLVARLARQSFSEAFAAQNDPADLAQFLDGAYGEAQQARELADPAWTTLLAWLGDRAVGFAQIRRCPPEPCVTGPHPVELHRLYLLQASHGSGAGSALMQAVVDRCRAEGFQTLWLGVWEHNARGLAFYRKWGFERVGFHTFRVGSDPQTDLIQVRPLLPVPLPREPLPASRRFLFLLASSRPDGNSEHLARRAARQLPEGAEARWLRLEDHPLPPFQDTRHSTGYSAPEGDAAHLAEATLWATDLVVVTPVYWYSLPARAKLYFDHWSGWMRVPALALKDTLKGRRMWAVITDSGTAEEGSASLVEGMLQRTALYMRMTWMEALVGHANQPGEIAKDTLAMTAAETYFQKPSPHV